MNHNNAAKNDGSTTERGRSENDYSYLSCIVDMYVCERQLFAELPVCPLSNIRFPGRYQFCLQYFFVYKLMFFFSGPNVVY